MVEFDANHISFGLIGGVLTEIQTLDVERLRKDRFGQGGFTSNITITTENDVSFDCSTTKEAILFSDDKIYILVSNEITYLGDEQTPHGSVVCFHNTNCEIATSYRGVTSVLSAYNQKL